MYPNMSYTMFSNTALAMRQLIDALRDDGKDLLSSMSSEERRAFKELAGGMGDLCSELQELYEEVVDDADDIGY